MDNVYDSLEDALASFDDEPQTKKEEITPARELTPAGVIVNGEIQSTKVDKQDINDLQPAGILGEEEDETSSTSHNTPGAQDNNPEQHEEFDLITAALRSRGISDPNNIKFQTETGIINRRFDELSNEEKLDILNTTADDVDLNEEEIKTINFLRENDLTLQQLVDYYKQQGVQEYLNSNQVFEIDSLTDEDLYRLYLQDNYSDFTEEDVEAELELAKSNEDLFKRKVDRLRNIYKETEAAEKQKEQEEASLAASEESKKFKAEVDTYGKGLGSIHGMELDESEHQAILDFLFKPQMGTNRSKLIDLMNDPKQMYRMAFYTLYGDELINQLHTMYQSELRKRESDYVKSLPKNPAAPKSEKAKLVQRKNHLNDWEKDMDLLWGLK